MKIFLFLALFSNTPMIKSKFYNQLKEIESLQSKCDSIRIQTISYPYKLDSLKSNILRKKILKCKIGQDFKLIIKNVGFPDEINLTYDKIYRSEIIGYTFVYLFERKQTSGSVNDKMEIYMRLSFDFEMKLLKVHTISWK